MDAILPAVAGAAGRLLAFAAMSSGELRVGTVPYLVGRPLDFGLERENGFSVARLVPAELVRALRAGELDVALVSSIELFRRPGYRYLDGLAVSGEGAIASVQVFLRAPLPQVRRVALDPSSEAAATLVRVLLTAQGAEREFVEVAPGSDPSRAEADAWLEIGDPALRRYLSPGAPPVFNPSQEWAARTGLPFAFAVWIVRPGVALRQSQIEAFARARAQGAGRIGALAAEASRAWKLPVEACTRYLAQECRYEPGPRLEPSLRAFRDAAAALGLCRGDLEPEPIAVPIAHVS
jgi:chorismate dehydratase